MNESMTDVAKWPIKTRDGRPIGTATIKKVRVDGKFQNWRYVVVNEMLVDEAERTAEIKRVP